MQICASLCATTSDSHRDIGSICVAKFSRSAGLVMRPELPARSHCNQSRAGGLALVANTERNC